MDPSNPLQQEVLGTLGVNLLFAVYHQRESRDVFLQGLAEGIAAGRIEIDLIDLRGPAFEAWDRRAFLVDVVRRGLAEGVVFPRDERTLPPTELLHKKPVVLAPGTFAAVEPIHGRILEATVAAQRAEEGGGETPVGMFVLTPDALSEQRELPDVPSILQRVDALHQMGEAVLVSRCAALYELIAFAHRFTSAAVRIAVGLPTLIRVFEDARSRHHEGRILENLTRLVGQDVRLFAYPMSVATSDEWLRALAAGGWEVTATGGWVTADGVRPPPPLSHLYAYLTASRFIAPLPPPAG